MIKESKSLITIFCIAIFFLICLGVSFWLLKEKYIDSQNFITLIIGSTVLVFLLIFIDRIVEVSLGGTVIKLERLNDKSEKLLEELQVEHFKMRIDLAFTSTGFWGGEGSSIYRSKIKFYEVLKDIKSEGMLNHPKLRDTIEMQLSKTLQQQLEDVQLICSKFSPNPLNGIVDPLVIKSFITPEVISGLVKSNSDMYKDKEATKNTIFTRIDVYEKLFNAKKWLEN